MKANGIVPGIRVGNFLALAVGLAAAGQVGAQELAGGDATMTLEEIVVTAQKREQRLIDVPVPITALTGKDITARGATNLQDIQYTVPGLTVAETGPGATRLALNGIGISGGVTGAPAVGRYLDEMPITAATGGFEMDLRMLDMERVEVLHGPQPTLYGEGSMGGTIHYVTASPDLHEFGGYALANWGSVTDGGENYRTSGVLNVPVIDGKLGVRLLGGWEQNDGWIDSAVSGREDVNEVTFKTARMKVLFEPVDTLSISLLAMYQDHDQPVQNLGEVDRVTFANYDAFSLDEYRLANLVVNWDLGFATLTNSTGYLHRQPQSAFDLTPAYLPFLPVLGLPPEVTSSIQSIGYGLVSEHEMLSEELRLASNPGTPFNWVVGGYFRDYRTKGTNRTVTAPGSLPFDLIDIRQRARSRTWAAFAEVRYEFERFEALVGIRHFEESQEASALNAGVLINPGLLRNEADFQSNNPRFNLSYRATDNVNVYLDVAKGFRTGVFNVGAAAGAPLTAAPEQLWTYTLGTKQQWLKRRLNFDLSVYRNEWSDMQTSVATSANPIGYIANAGEASGWGSNLTLQALPIPELSLSASVGWTDMQSDTTTASRFKGDPLDMVSELTYSASAEWRREVATSRTLIARLDYQYSDGYQVVLRNNPGQEVFPVDSRSLLNARLGMDFGGWQGFVYGTNLTDNDGILFPAAGAFHEPSLSSPRTIGVDLRFEF